MTLSDLSKVPALPQDQGSLDDQMALLIAAANKLGLYDASGWVYGMYYSPNASRRLAQR